MKRRVVSVLLALCLLAGLAACGEKAPESSGAPSSSAGEDMRESSAESSEVSQSFGTGTVIQDSSTESSEASGSEPLPKGGTVARGPMDDYIEDNLRLSNNLYCREDGALFFNDNNSFEAVELVQKTERGDLPPSSELKYAYTEGGAIKLLYNNGQMHYVGTGNFPGEELAFADMHRSSEDIDAAVTTDGRVLRFIYVNSRDHGFDEYEEVAELGSNVKYIRTLDANSIIAVNGDGTVGFFGSENHPSLEEITGWTDIAWISTGTVDKVPYAVGLKNDGTVVATGNCPVKADAEAFTDMVYVCCDRKLVYGLTSSGTIELARADGPVEDDVLGETGIKAVYMNDVGSTIFISAVTKDGRPLGAAKNLCRAYIPGQTQVDTENGNRTEVGEGLILPNAVGEKPGDRFPIVESWP